MNFLPKDIPHKLELRTFGYKGGYIVLDVSSSTIFQVNKEIGACLRYFNGELCVDKVTKCLHKFGEHITDQTIGTIRDLYLEGAITESSEKQEVPPIPDVASIFLNVSHACNLNCVYCYADGGSYGTLYRGNQLMNGEVAKAAIDYLIENSGDWPRLSINFFGGEPLLNWQVIKDAILYGRDKALAHSKQLTFGVTTNATRVSRQILNFIRQHDVQFLVSLDGDQQSHDAMRKTRSGDGSYAQTLHGAKTLLENNRSVTRVRATLSRGNADIFAVFQHLLSWFDCISIGYVSDPKEFSLTSEQWPLVRKGYRSIINAVIQELRQTGKFINFLEFTEDVARLYAGRKAYRCGTGKWSRAIDTKGDIYPCQRFVGLEEYRLGDVWKGDVNTEVLSRFHSLNIFSNPTCSTCWARYLCGGGCPHVSLMESGNFATPAWDVCRWLKFALTEAMRQMAELNDAGESYLIDSIYQRGTGIDLDPHS